MFTTYYNESTSRLEFMDDSGASISPIHDIPLYVDKAKGIVNMIVEIPRGTRAKMEMATDEPLNPIKQDMKKGKLRFVHYPYPFNYGAFPQTWENPDYVDKNTKSKGDGDPIDACEIGSTDFNVGDVINVKILGIWAMIDQGETDWKVLCINTEDPLAKKLNSIQDVEKHLPGVIDYYYNFLKNYKLPSGDEPNTFAFKGKLKDKKFTKQIVQETHEQWEEALETQNEKIALKRKSTEEWTFQSMLDSIFGA